jgi:NTE family protein
MNAIKEKSLRLGLALSGGGYRAAVFHLGTLNKLNELNILTKVDVLSTISGGSIIGAAFCLHDGNYASFHEMMYDRLKTKNVITQVLRSFTLIKFYCYFFFFIVLAIYFLFYDHPWLFILDILLMFFIFFKYQFRLFPISIEIEKAYNKFFYNNKTLIDFKGKPLLAIGSSNLHTGRPFTFSKLKMSDSTYAYEYTPPIFFLQENFPVARAVMASSCVPFAFSPVKIDKSFYKNSMDCQRVHPQLVDGGVYDNQGLQKITQSKSMYECNTIIVSDAGGLFMADEKYPNVVSLAIRTMNLFMNRIKTAQIVQNIYRNVRGSEKPIAYVSLGWRIKNCIPGFVNNMISGHVIKEVLDGHGFDPLWIADPNRYRNDIETFLQGKTGYPKILQKDLTEDEYILASNAGTNLCPLSEECMKCLIRHAENFTELQVRLYCPALLKDI